MRFNFITRIVNAARCWVLLLLFFQVFAATAQVCAPPGSLLDASVTGIINDYYTGANPFTLNPGDSTLNLGARDTRGGPAATIAVGDLFMIMQMQGGTINASTTNQYGSGAGTGNGSLTLDNVGFYEFIRVTSVAGLNIGFTPPLTKQYKNSTGIPQNRYQVIRVPQYANVTATAVTTIPWNSSTGGVVALDAKDVLTLAGGNVAGLSGVAIYAGGLGFRGALGKKMTDTFNIVVAGEFDIHVRTAPPATPVSGQTDWAAGKGEGIHGTPVYMAKQNSVWSFGNVGSPTASIAEPVGPEGYLGGSWNKGGPGNAGGGGNVGGVYNPIFVTANANNAQNSGGGGGGNFGAGGIGGRPWANPTLDAGGRPGAGYSSVLAFNRLFMGGGAGAGITDSNTSGDTLTHTTTAYPNNAIACGLGTPTLAIPVAEQCSSGASGGGIVIVRARSVTGAGRVDVRGAHGWNVRNNAAGGGGAGGSAVIETLNGGNVTIDARGGDGGNAWATNTNWPTSRHGPGGAGGGGFIAFAPATLAVSSQYDGGLAGQTLTNTFAVGGPLIENYGSSSADGGIVTFQVPNVPGVVQAAKCDPALTLTKTDGVTSLTSPGTTTYTLTITNSGATNASGAVTIADQLPSGLSVTPGPLALTGPSAALWTCTAANATDITCTTLSSITALGGTQSFNMAVVVSAPNGVALINKAQVSGGGDPLKTSTATPATAATCTGNAAPLGGCAVDTDTVVAPNLVLVKTNNRTQLSPAISTTYVLAVTNVGSAPTSDVITVADLLPTGLTYSGASPFTVAGFTCNVSLQGITCTSLSALAASSTASFTFTVSVGPTPPSSVLNLAQVGGGGDPSPAKSAAPTTATAALCAAPVSPATESSDPNNGCAADIDEIRYVNLDLNKDDGQVYVNRGGYAEYAMTVRNFGTITTTGTITLVDTFPNFSTSTLPGTTAIGSVTATFNTTPSPYTPTGTNGANWTCTVASVTLTTCISTVQIPPNGSSEFNLRVNIHVQSSTSSFFLNRARIGGGGDVNIGMINVPNATDTQACTSNGVPRGCAIDLDVIQPQSPLIRLTKSHPSPQAKSVGNTVSFVLVVSNTGGLTNANTVRMVDVLPIGLTTSLANINLTAATPFTCAIAAQVVTCNNTAAAVAATRTYTITLVATVTAVATNPLLNPAQVGTNGSDPTNATFPTSVTAVLCTGVNIPTVGCAADPVPLLADLQILKLQRIGTAGVFSAVPIAVPIGATVQYQITVANPAPSISASTMTFADTVPNAFSTVTVMSAVGTGSALGCAASMAGNLMSGTVTTVPANGTCTVILQAIASALTLGATNTAILTIPTGISDTNAANNSSSVPAVVGYTNLTLTKTNGVNSLIAGGTTSYTITVANLGPTPAPGVLLTDPAVLGLSCTTVTCAETAANMCPLSPTIGTLQGPGLLISPAFPVGSSATFVIACDVTATGR